MELGARNFRLEHKPEWMLLPEQAAHVEPVDGQLSNQYLGDPKMTKNSKK